ncbi:MAG: hypothetical protein M2R45_04325 [Verrucomicrobia subdivision 3 bacterium]|nr:hypothetical protein [Limisphaerales bacterium]MCS1417240.1 hypothetical protein [Limisphaerales bacterium]
MRGASVLLGTSVLFDGAYLLMAAIAMWAEVGPACQSKGFSAQRVAGIDWGPFVDDLTPLGDEFDVSFF